MNLQPIYQTKEKGTKRERLEARISPRQKLLLQQAADLQGRTLSEFLVRSAEDAANQVIREHTIVRLSADDSRAFVEALISPSKPNKKLKAAYSSYKRMVSSQS